MFTKNQITHQADEVGKEAMLRIANNYADNGVISRETAESFSSLSETEIATALKGAINGAGAWIDDLPEAYDGLKVLLRSNALDNDMYRLFNGLDVEDKIAMADSWIRLKSNSYVRTDATRFEVFQQLSESNQVLIAKYTDESATSSLAGFLDDLDDEFLELIEGDSKYLECFLSHKEDTKWTLEQFEQFSESIKVEEQSVLSTKVEKWIDHSSYVTQLGKVTEKGRIFENSMLNAVKNKNSREYIALAEKVSDLGERKLLSQVQFCLPGFEPPCTAKGEYFIADQVWVKYDDFDEIQDMIVVDAKLSEGTSLTSGQTTAKNQVGNDVGLRYKENYPIDNDILEVELPSDINQGDEILIVGFYKMFGDGESTFVDVKKQK